MQIISIILYTCIAGIASMFLGGVLCIFIKKPSSKAIGNLFNIASGLMLGITFFGLLPEAFNLVNIYITLLCTAIGSIIILLIDSFLTNKECVLTQNAISVNTNVSCVNKNKINKTSKILLISIALHNFPEGLAVGASFNLSIGFATLIAIALHDIPEGIVVALPMKANDAKSIDIIKNSIFAGVPTILGGITGYYLSAINTAITGISLAFASGAMLSVVFLELIPQANSYSDNKTTPQGVVYLLMGIILAGFISFLT